MAVFDPREKAICLELLERMIGYIDEAPGVIAAQIAAASVHGLAVAYQVTRVVDDKESKEIFDRIIKRLEAKSQSCRQPVKDLQHKSIYSDTSPARF